MADRIIISNLSIHLPNGLGPSAFGLTPPPACPITLDLIINLHPTLIPLVATHDSMSSLGVNYSSVSKAIYAALSVPTRIFAKAEEVLEVVAGVVLMLECVDSVQVSLGQIRALLHAQEVRYGALYTRTGYIKEMVCEIRDMRVSCVVGLHPHERKEKQRLEVDIKVSDYDHEWTHKAVHDTAISYLEQSSAGTLELLVDQLARHIFDTIPLPPQAQLSLTIRKPSALPFATPSISIQRSRASYVHPPPQAIAGPSRSSGSELREGVRAFIALGSNIGDRVNNIRRAVNALEEIERGEVQVTRTGRMYESEPMYVEDQARFINTVIEICTSLEPLALLQGLKKVERATGRTKTFTNGPRVVDLDLLFYGDQNVKVGQKGDGEDEYGVGWLEVPHWGIAEREFVLRPLNDISPTFVHPTLKLPISVLLARHPETLVPIIPTRTPLRLDSHSTPLIMAIFNATPDSFSDGSATNLDIPSALSNISAMLDSDNRPSILDIGGMSTRPNSTPCSEEEELDRVVPLIQVIRAKHPEVVISIDTYRPAVARAAVKAGADMINDVRGGREDGMMASMAELGVPVVLMHSRGDSATMTTASMQDYTSLGGVVVGVKSELGKTVSEAMAKRVRGWDIVLDPGIGFAKSPTQSIELLKHLDQMSTLSLPISLWDETQSRASFPILVGASRKGFVGQVTGRKEASARGWGDAVVYAYCASRAGGSVSILRVHDWRGAVESVRMARALWDE